MNSSKTGQPTDSSKLLEVAVFSSIIILIAMKLIDIYIPGSRLWGVDQFSYFPRPYIIIALLLCFILTCTLYLSEKTGLISRSVEVMEKIFKLIPPALRLILGAVLIITIFAYFKDSTNLLGDGILRLGELEVAGLERISNTAAAEPLDYLLHHVSYKFFFEPFNLSPKSCFLFWSVLSGLIFVWFARKFSGKLDAPEVGRTFTFAYLVSWGGIMLFFGYVEDYSIAAAFVMMFFYYVIEYLNTGRKFICINLIFLVAFFLHNITMILLPGVIFINFLEIRNNKTRSLLISGITLITIAAWIAFTFAEKQSGGFLLPDSGSEPGYLVFGREHLLDILNGLFLLSPSFLALIWIQKIRGHKNLNRLHLHYILLLTSVTGFAAAFIIDPHLGMARDWDLIAIPLLPLHIFIFVNARWEKIGKAALYAIIFFQIISTISWILLNTDENRSISRYIKIAALDNKRSRLGFNRLGDYFLERQRWQEAENALLLSLKVGPHYRSYLGLGVARKNLGKYNEAVDAFANTLKLSPDEPLALFELGSYYYSIGDLKKARALFLRLRATPLGSRDRRLVRMLDDIERRLQDSEDADQ